MTTLPDTNPTAAVLVIGNEILSGRTQDTNTNTIAKALTAKGIALSEVRVVPDIEGTIIEALNALRGRFDHVFTTGGIGPTHDDITADCVAMAFDVALENNQEAHDILEEYYGAADLTPARLRMARIPAGAALIPNPVSAAPGFTIGNVHVMAGVPRIMKAMLDHVVSTIEGGALMISRTIHTELLESQIAEGLAQLQAQFPDVEIGSYPHFKNVDRKADLGVNIVLRSTDEGRLEEVEKALQPLLALER